MHARRETLATAAAHPLRVLAIEDDPDHAELLRLRLAAIPGLALEFRHEPDGPVGLLLAATGRFDAVFVDRMLGATRGEDVARLLRGRGFRGAIVLVTAHWSDDLPALAERCGANAFLDKARITPRLLAATLELDAGAALPLGA